MEPDQLVILKLADPLTFASSVLNLLKVACSVSSVAVSDCSCRFYIFIISINLPFVFYYGILKSAI